MSFTFKFSRSMDMVMDTRIFFKTSHGHGHERFWKSGHGHGHGHKNFEKSGHGHGHGHELFENRGMVMDMVTNVFENRGTAMDMDTNFLKNRGMVMDMVTASNRCPPNSGPSYNKHLQYSILRANKWDNQCFVCWERDRLAITASRSTTTGSATTKLRWK